MTYHIYGNTPLFVAFLEGHLLVAQCLLDREDLDVNAEDYSGRTALLIAASQGCALSVSKLLKHPGIDARRCVEETDLLWGSLPVTRKWSALDICQAKGFRHVEKFLSSFLLNDMSDHESFSLHGDEGDEGAIYNRYIAKQSVQSIAATNLEMTCPRNQAYTARLQFRPAPLPGL